MSDIQIFKEFYCFKSESDKLESDYMLMEIPKDEDEEETKKRIKEGFYETFIQTYIEDDELGDKIYESINEGNDDYIEINHSWGYVCVGEELYEELPTNISEIRKEYNLLCGMVSVSKEDLEDKD